MAYKPVICELKCVSRDIKKAIEDKDEDEDKDLSLKEEIQELIQKFKNVPLSRWGALLRGTILYGVVVAILIYFNIFNIFVVIIWTLIFIFMVYLFYKYIYRVHERCIRHAKEREEVGKEEVKQ